MIEKAMEKSPSYWALITVKNGADTISKSVESILSQTVKPSLICIVDDGSTDKTPMILTGLKEKSGRYDTCYYLA